MPLDGRIVPPVEDDHDLGRNIGVLLSIPVASDVASEVTGPGLVQRNQTVAPSVVEHEVAVTSREVAGRTLGHEAEGIMDEIGEETLLNVATIVMQKDRCDLSM